MTPTDARRVLEEHCITGQEFLSYGGAMRKETVENILMKQYAPHTLISDFEKAAKEMKEAKK